MTSDRTPVHSRRNFLVAGGASVLGAAALSACAGSSVVNTSGGVASTLVEPTAPPTTASAAALQAGRALARTITSAEHSLAAFYDEFAKAEYLDADTKAWGTLFGSHHRLNAEALARATTTAGGTAYTESNAYLDSELVQPGLKLANSTKSATALISLAGQLESTGAATGTLAIASIVDIDLRGAISAVAATNARQAYVWQLMAKPGDLAGALPDALFGLRDALPGAAAVDKATGD